MPAEDEATSWVQKQRTEQGSFAPTSAGSYPRWTDPDNEKPALVLAVEIYRR
jgi:hypothetical protein